MERNLSDQQMYPDPQTCYPHTVTIVEPHEQGYDKGARFRLDHLESPNISVVNSPHFKTMAAVHEYAAQHAICLIDLKTMQQMRREAGVYDMKGQWPEDDE